MKKNWHHVIFRITTTWIDLFQVIEKFKFFFCSLFFVYVRYISLHCIRIPIRSHSRRTTQKRAFSNLLAGGSTVSGRGCLRVADNWHPFPVLHSTIQRSSDVLKKKRGHVPSSRAPLLRYGPCSSQCVLGTWNIIRSCWKASFLRTRRRA